MPDIKTVFYSGVIFSNNFTDGWVGVSNELTDGDTC